MNESLVKFCIDNGLPFVIRFPEPWYLKTERKKNKQK